ncbi:VWA-like domain-containing protein [Streptosporangium sp. NPDC023615]|uniref:vWA domain-containing protein n=1 Tax=Streptosporangium sp. NPDC023615 TaxID=3154794 RepID=UPI00343ACE88
MTGPAEAAPVLAEQVAARFAAARLWAAHRAPYLAAALFALNPVVLEPSFDDATGEPVADPEFRAFPADTRWNVHVETGTALATPVEEIGWWLLHQIGHLVRAHAARSPVRPAHGNTHAAGEAGSAEARRWNQAADAEINDDLEAEGLHGPAGVISPALLGLPPNRTAEEYVPMLDVLAEALGRGGVALSDAVDCGGAADGLDRGHHSPGPGGSGGLGELERELLERSIAAGVQERAATRGDVPLGLRRWAEGRLRPEVDWRALLGSLIRRGVSTAAGRVDFGHRRPSRRAGATPGIVMPAMVGPAPSVAVVIDTSGSVGRPVLGRLVAETTGVLNRAAGPRRRLRVICCDTVAHPVQEIRRAQDAVAAVAAVAARNTVNTVDAMGAMDAADAGGLALTGGGGTDMRAGIAAAVALRPRPDLVIVMTDGLTPWPERRPPAQVIVCLVGEEGQAPAWAATVRVPTAGVPDSVPDRGPGEVPGEEEK